ncbi:MAG: exodeoxyribonuclease V subunit gamma [Chitinispirillaceae bacterium]|nr:exodeoxyribonuclease V subunit gamma [Chitinispirillaceae bacterium]
MLHLHFAPSLDMLVADLLLKLRYVRTDPFVAPDIIVPNPALGKWLRMRLADGCVEGGGAGTALRMCREP